MTVLPQGPDLETYSDEELTEERDFLLRSLRDLEAEQRAGDVDDHDYEVLRDGYTARAAAVLRTLDGRRDDAADPEAADPGAAGPGAAGPDGDGGVRSPRGGRGPARPGVGRRLRAVIIAGAVALFAVGAGLLVADNAGRRLPGETVSGSTPNNKIQQLLALAGSDVQKGDVLGALKTFQQVLATDPRNVEALAGQGWLIAITGNTAHDQGLMDRGLASVRSAEQIDPSYASAHFFAGSILLDESKAADAVSEFEQYLADDPSSPQAALVRQDLQTAQALAAGKLPPGASAVPPSTTATTR